ncbi:hypothetical protein [Microbacterium aurum]
MSVLADDGVWIGSLAALDHLPAEIDAGGVAVAASDALRSPRSAERAGMAGR